jgi:fatty acid desaturase
MKRSPVVHRLLALFIAGWLVFDFPLLQLWSQRPWVLFALWAGVIAVLAWLMEREEREERDEP